MLSAVDGVIGNSSSGLAEAPSFKIGTINIGDRQKGRIQASSVLNCEASQSHVVAAIEEMYSDDFQSGLKTTVNPYGTGGASQRIVEILKEVNLEGLIMKSFNDL
jgi:GDP/UDP-N,N'-diacetylbacillosamine 2-epimerase (hydrolysing)